MVHIYLYTWCSLTCSSITPGEGARTGADRARDPQTEAELQVLTSLGEITGSDLILPAFTQTTTCCWSWSRPGCPRQARKVQLQTGQEGLTSEGLNVSCREVLEKTIQYINHLNEVHSKIEPGMTVT